jgi:ribose transport system ATP-binding protein
MPEMPDSAAVPSLPLLEMRNVSKRFGGVAALQNVSVQVGKAEVLALIGENGAGKSTLMKVLGGVHFPDEGEIRVEGEPVRITSVRDSTRLGVAFIHQELSVLDNLDVAANIFLGREETFGGPLRLLASRRMAEEATVYLKQVGLEVPPDTLVSRLSLAQRQMLEIARSLSQKARLIIMDEPTASLTPAETERLLNVIRDLRNRGVSVIYISHRLREIEAVADRVTGLRDGKNAGDLARNEITHDRMVRMMVGRELERSPRSKGTLPPDARPRLDVRDLRTRRYPNQTVSFTVNAGEILGFAGLVGAGRTEVAQALFGVEPALAGDIRLDGETVTIRSPQDAIARGLYLIPEDRRRLGLILDMPIRENISLPSLLRFLAPPSLLHLIDRNREQQSATENATRLNVKAASVEAHVGTLSGGNQQKVVLAKWLSRRPRVLIFDEPTRGVDVGAKAEIYARIRELAAAEEGVAVVCISSDMEEVLNLCDRVAVMHEGHITGILDFDAMNEEAIMALAVGGTAAMSNPSTSR